MPTRCSTTCAKSKSLAGALPEVASEPAVREFVRALFLSGNGAVIFYANSFVEWAASEAFRRARPSFVAAQFGIRKRRRSRLPPGSCRPG